jgi:hypothetical protein
MQPAAQTDDSTTDPKGEIGGEVQDPNLIPQQNTNDENQSAFSQKLESENVEVMNDAAKSEEKRLEKSEKELMPMPVRLQEPSMALQVLSALRGLSYENGMAYRPGSQFNNLERWAERVFPNIGTYRGQVTLCFLLHHLRFVLLLLIPAFVFHIPIVCVCVCVCVHIPTHVQCACIHISYIHICACVYISYIHIHA